MKKGRATVQMYVLAFFTVAVVVFSAISINIFITGVRRNAKDEADNSLIVASDNGVAMIQDVFESYKKQLRNIALAVQQYDNIYSPEVIQLLNEFSQANGYERLAINSPEGYSHTSDGLKIDMRKLTDISRITQDFEVISDVNPAMADGKSVVSLTTPLWQNGKIIASLRLTISTQNITSAINLSLFYSEGYYHLVDVNGNYVADVKNSNALLMEQNFFEAINNLEYTEGYSAQQIINCFNNGQSTFSRYNAQGHSRYAYCRRAGINNWVLMTIVPSEVLALSEQRTFSHAINLTVQLAIVLISIFVVIYWIQRRERKIAQLNDKCFRALSEQTGKIIFEWHFADRRLTASSKFHEIFGRDAVTQYSHEEALSTEMVHPDDASAFISVFTDLYHSVNFENVRFRIKHADGTYHWCTLAGVIVSDWKGRAYRAIGTLEDINDTVVRENTLKQKSETDLLTGLYNKATTESLIIAALAQEQEAQSKCALLIADIDNFKNINDTLGHQTGDVILQRFATMLVPFVRKTDIVGRIGGDEFFIFFRNFEDEQAIRTRAENICSKFGDTRSEAEVACGISISIGISFFPQNANDFATLYKQADIALYRTKRSGKNGYIVYNPSFGSQISEIRTAIDNQLS